MEGAKQQRNSYSKLCRSCSYYFFFCFYWKHRLIIFITIIDQSAIIQEVRTCIPNNLRELVRPPGCYIYVAFLPPVQIWIISNNRAIISNNPRMNRLMHTCNSIIFRFFLKMSFDASKIRHLVKHGSLIVENANMNQYRLFRVKIFLHPNIPASCQPILLACG